MGYPCVYKGLFKDFRLGLASELTTILGSLVYILLDFLTIPFTDLTDRL